MTERENIVNKDEMKEQPLRKVTDGAKCEVIAGVHAGKVGRVRDIKSGKTGHISITVVQSSGVRFKTLARNVVILEE
jgi:ribosomal protein S4E